MSYRQEKIELGPVELGVADLRRAREFYGAIVGLETLAASETRAELGTGERVLLTLTAGARRSAPAGARFALLLANRLELARALNRLRERGYPLDRAEDSAVSETLWLTDPDGGAVALYRDRAATSWPQADSAASGEAGLLPLDLADLLAELRGMSAAHNRWVGLAPGASIGWLGLAVPDVEAALAFYRDELGLAVSGRENAAVHLASGGYHRQIVLAQPAPGVATDCRLRSFGLNVAGHALPQPLATRLTQNGGALRLRDPAGYEIQLINRATTTPDAVTMMAETTESAHKTRRPI